jgi:hypothetical protein
MMIAKGEIQVFFLEQFYSSDFFYSPQLNDEIAFNVFQKLVAKLAGNSDLFTGKVYSFLL